MPKRRPLIGGVSSELHKFLHATAVRCVRRTCLQFRRCLVAGTNRVNSACPGRYSTASRGRLACTRSLERRTAGWVLLPVCCLLLIAGRVRCLRQTRVRAPRSVGVVTHQQRARRPTPRTRSSSSISPTRKGRCVNDPCAKLTVRGSALSACGAAARRGADKDPRKQLNSRSVRIKIDNWAQAR